MLNKRKIIIIVFSVLYAALFAFMMYQSLSPSAESIRQSELITGILIRIKFFSDLEAKGVLTDFVRKVIGHFSEFALLGMIGYTVFSNAMESDYSLLINSGAGLITAIIVESAQYFAAGRAPAVLDVALDLSGYLTALSFLAVITYIIDLIGKQTSKTFAKKVLYSLPAYLLALLPFGLYSVNSEGFFFSLIVFISLFVVSMAFTLVIYFKKSKRSAK